MSEVIVYRSHNADCRPVVLVLQLVLALLTACERAPVAGGVQPETRVVKLPVLHNVGPSATARRPLVEVDRDAIRVDGKLVQVDRSLPETLGPADLQFPAVVHAIQALSERPTKALLAVDSTVPYHVLFRVLYSARFAGISELAVAARRGPEVVEVPLGFRGLAPAVPDPEQLRLIVSITSTSSQISLWSLTGYEGTIDAPRVAIPRAAADYSALTRKLQEILGRRFATKSRTEDERALGLSPSVDIPLQEIIHVVAAARWDATGRELFESVYLTFGLSDS